MDNNEPRHITIYDKCMELAKANPGLSATPWIHLSDAVESGTISPMEAYNALDLGYLPQNLTVRKSRYSHLL